MEFPPVSLLAFSNPLAPIIGVLHTVLSSIFGVVHNYGWSLLILAGLIKLCMWPLNTMQFKSMLAVQELSPKIKALQAKYKDDKEKLNEQTMALYKEKGANPLAGCLPMLLQMPILYSVFYAITNDRKLFSEQSWLWIGSPLAIASPHHFLAASLAAPDYVLLLVYMFSMYFLVRFTSPPSPDPQVAQQQRMMAFISPAMIGFLGFKYAWPSGLIIYWLSFNLFTILQQFYLIEKYHRNPAVVGPHPELTTAGAPAPAAKDTSSNAATNGAPPKSGSGGGGSRAARRRRSSRR